MAEASRRPITLFTYGFRPFFLMAGIYAVFAIAAWLAWLLLHAGNVAVTRPTIAEAPHLWHGHEMLFGYAVAVLSGFLLTAVPNWTGTAPFAGPPLAMLAAAWLAGRIALWFSAFLPAWLVAAIDLAYLPLLMLVVARALLQRPAARNLIFIALMALLLFANVAVHAEWLGLTEDTAAWGLKLAIVVLALMITIIGGRVVPAFTRNALVHRGDDERLPRRMPRLNQLCIASSLAVVIAVLTDWPAGLGAVALAAGLINGVRLALWRPTAGLSEPIIWSLHLGYLGLVAGYLALAAADLGGWPSETAALHVIAIAGIGGMTLAIMTRAALGHTGRALRVAPQVAAAYVLVAVAALVRGFGTALLPSHYFAVITVAALCWMAAFGLFTFCYAPILAGPAVAAGDAT